MYVLNMQYLPKLPLICCYKAYCGFQTYHLIQNEFISKVTVYWYIVILLQTNVKFQSWNIRNFRICTMLCPMMRWSMYFCFYRGLTLRQRAEKTISMRNIDPISAEINPEMIAVFGDRTDKNFMEYYYSSHVWGEGQWLTHWGRYKIATISQKTFSNAFYSMKMYEFYWRFYLNLFPRFFIE